RDVRDLLEVLVELVEAVEEVCRDGHIGRQNDVRGIEGGDVVDDRKPQRLVGGQTAVVAAARRRAAGYGCKARDHQRRECAEKPRRFRSTGKAGSRGWSFRSRRTSTATGSRAPAR